MSVNKTITLTSIYRVDSSSTNTALGAQGHGKGAGSHWCMMDHAGTTSSIQIIVDVELINTSSATASNKVKLIVAQTNPYQNTIWNSSLSGNASTRVNYSTTINYDSSNNGNIHQVSLIFDSTNSIKFRSNSTLTVRRTITFPLLSAGDVISTTTDAGRLMHEVFLRFILYPKEGGTGISPTAGTSVRSHLTFQDPHWANHASYTFPHSINIALPANDGTVVTLPSQYTSIASGNAWTETIRCN